MNGATAESQAPVLCRALAAHGFAATPGRKSRANCITIRGAKSADRSIVRAICYEYAKGFDVDVRLSQTYWIVTLFDKSCDKSPPEDVPSKIVRMDGY